MPAVAAPVMACVAGPLEQEPYRDDRGVFVREVQRCLRCDSLLAVGATVIVKPGEPRLLRLSSPIAAGATRRLPGACPGHMPD